MQANQPGENRPCRAVDSNGARRIVNSYKRVRARYEIVWVDLTSALQSINNHMRYPPQRGSGPQLAPPPHPVELLQRIKRGKEVVESEYTQQTQFESVEEIWSHPIGARLMYRLSEAIRQIIEKLDQHTMRFCRHHESSGQRGPTAYLQRRWGCGSGQASTMENRPSNLRHITNATDIPCRVVPSVDANIPDPNILSSGSNMLESDIYCGECSSSEDVDSMVWEDE
ncbi:hypothetical protein SAMD00023353_0900080 [Rosellinia necatrix]|uniref:Uncharacterized protein n=1 Tax=Rosellinia necatrix TaxID=77044 RepID=A0A1W2THD9_ROSNE|nr:hypothetical protein SAMD00023353_0900080 [Rosellinia necatrix]